MHSQTLGANTGLLANSNLRKIKILLQALDDLGTAVDYYALDLSEPELRRSLEQVPPGTFEHIKCHGLLGTYDNGRAWLQRVENVHRPKCVISLGSTIGSFSRVDGRSFLSSFSTFQIFIGVGLSIRHVA